MPLDPKLNKFTTTAPIIASYDWNDVESGTGIDNYYIIVGFSGGALKHNLITNQYNSWQASIVSNSDIQNLVFDSLEFSTSRTVKGTAYFASGYWANGAEVAVSAKLQKWDGSTATDLTASFSTGNSPAAAVNNAFFVMPITATGSDAVVSVGDQLRLLITWDSNDSDSYLGASPTNQTGGGSLGTNSQTVIGVPFELNV